MPIGPCATAVVPHTTAVVPHTTAVVPHTTAVVPAHIVVPPRSPSPQKVLGACLHSTLELAPTLMYKLSEDDTYAVCVQLLPHTF